MDRGGDPLVGRRQLLRWGAALGLAGALGCTRTGGQDPAASPGPGRPGTTARPRPPSEKTDAAGGSESAGQQVAEADPTTRAGGGAGDLPTVEVLCRDAVGLLAARDGGRPHRLRHLTLHHSALPLTDDRAVAVQLRHHQRFHLEQGWVDIAYHFAVDLRGNIYELRDPAVASDTFTDYDPAGHLGVVCEGDYSQQHPSDAMLEATALVLAHAVTAHRLSPSSLAGHRDHALTGCPGDHLAVHVPELRREVERLTADPVERITVCGADGRARVAAIERGA